MHAGLEAALTGTGGAVLGAGALALLGPAWAVAGAVVAGSAGAVSGYRQCYDWRSWRGWGGFALDCTWGLVGTAAGLLLHAANLVWPGARYGADCSRRQNRHVYFGGFALKRGYTFTQGNVMSSAPGSAEDTRPRFLARHEGLHVTQSRLFGPAFQGLYLAWVVAGGAVGAIAWLFDRSEGFATVVQTTAYYDNPFEYWAYVRDEYWPHPDASRKLSWPRPRPDPQAALARASDQGPCTPPY